MTDSSGRRILYLIDSLAPGGAERSLVDMAPRLLSRGVWMEVAVLHDRPGLGPELQSAGIPVQTIGGTNRAQWLRRVVGLLRSRRPELLHTTLFESDIVGRSAALLTGVPVVSTLANTPYGPEHAAENGVHRFRLAGARTADMATAKVVKRFHAVSQATAEAYIRRLGIDPARVSVIPRGRDLARLGRPSEDRRRRVRSAMRLDPDVPLLLAVGRQEPQKGFDVLLRSLPRVLDAHPAAVLLLAGRYGRATEALRRLTAEHHLESAVRLLGERDDVPDLLAAADVFILSSFREGLPGVVLEAMAMEVPIVASDLPMVREAVPDETFAHFAPAGDPETLASVTVRCLSNLAEAREKALRARKRFGECFDIDSVSDRMVEFYEIALSTRRLR